MVNAANRDRDWDRLQGFLNDGAELVDQSGGTAMLAVQGPASQAVLAGVLEGPLSPHRGEGVAPGPFGAGCR